MSDKKSTETEVTPAIQQESPAVAALEVSARPGMLFAKLARVMLQLNRLPKNGRNTQQNYPFVTDADVLDAIRNLLAEQNVAFLPRMITVKQDDGPASKNGSIPIHTVVRFEYTFACGDTAQVWTSEWEGECLEWSDKGISKAATLALKYFLLKTFMISTGEPNEDPDEDTIERGKKGNKPAQRQQQQKPSQQPPPASTQPPPGKTETVATWATAESMNKLRGYAQSKGIVWAEIPSLLTAITKPDDPEQWGKAYKDGKVACEALWKAFETRQQNSGPAKPKSGSKPDHQWTEAEINEMDILASLWWDSSMMLPMDAETLLKGMGKIGWSEFKGGPQEAKAALKAYAISQVLPIIAHVAQFQNQYTVFSNGQISARLYWRDMLRELSDNWMNYADNWEKGKKYDLLKDNFMLTVNWIDKDGKYLEVVSVEPFEQVDFDKEPEPSN